MIDNDIIKETMKSIERKPINLNGNSVHIDKNRIYNSLPEDFIYQCLISNERGDAELLERIFKNTKIFNLSDNYWYNYSNGVYQKDKLHNTRLEAVKILKDIYNSYLDNVKSDLNKAIKDNNSNKDESIEDDDIEKIESKDFEKNKRKITWCKSTIKAVKKKIDDLNTKSKSNNIMDILSRDFLKCTTEQFDNDNYLINLRNGVYDLKNHKLLKHDQSYLMRKQTGFDYNPQIYADKWLIFLNQIFKNDADVIRFFQQLLGIWLTGSSDFQYLVFAYGSGANGKSTVFNIIQWLMNGEDPLKKNNPSGDGYFQKFDIQALLVQKNNKNVSDGNLASLQAVRLALATELPTKTQLNEALIKDITGGEMIRARMLYSEAFNFHPTHKTIIFGNHKPTIKDVSEGFWRRVLLLPFEHTFSESERKPMSTILNEMKLEFSGIFNWAMDGLKDYQKNGLFIPDAVKSATEEYRNENNQLLQYFDDRKDDFINDKYNSKIKFLAKDLFEDYEKWVKEDESNRVQVFSSLRSFNSAIRSLGYITKKMTDNKTFIIGLQKIGGLYD